MKSFNRFESPGNKDKISDVERDVFDLMVSEHNDSAIQLADHEGSYSAEEIERDLTAVERKKSKLLQENPERHKRAVILETVLSEQIELSDWFGKNALTITPSEYDDLFHGVDIAAEFKEEGGFKYLAIDITSSAKAVERKIRKIKEGIRTGQLTEVKYFSSERNSSPDLPGPLKQLPNAIIGVDSRTIIELSRIWLEIFKAKKAKSRESSSNAQDLYAADIKTAKDKLARHRVQVLILKELEKQLEVFSDFAMEIGRVEVAKKYQYLLKIIGDILRTKNISKDAEKINNTDDVYTAIEENLKNFDSL